MVEQFRQLAENLSKEGYPEAARRTLIFSRELRREDLVPDTLEKDQIMIKEKIFNFEDFSFYPERHYFISAGKDVRLTKMESGILEVMARHPNRVLSKNLVISLAWGTEYVETAALRTQIKNLRKKLKQQEEGKNGDPIHIANVTGKGYMLIVPGLSEEANLPEADYEQIFKLPGFSFLPESMAIRIDGKNIFLTKWECSFLLEMCTKSDGLANSHSLLGGSASGKISNLRKKLDKNLGDGAGMKFIRTIWGKGYMLVDPNIKE